MNISLAGVCLGLADSAARGLGADAEVGGELFDLGFGSEVRYIRTARSHISSVYFFGAAMAGVPLKIPYLTVFHRPASQGTSICGKGLVGVGSFIGCGCGSEPGSGGVCSRGSAGRRV